LTDEDWRYLTSLHDDRVPLPPEAEALRDTHPRLRELRAAYGALELPVTVASRWHAGAIHDQIDLRWFRGETLFVWHYRELPRITQLKYYILARYVAERDSLGLLTRLEEDGRFGCWTFSYPGFGRLSRDLLESVNELSFLERQLGLSARPRVSVLDIGAGYGRLAHRAAGALPNLADWCCVDAIAEATFLSEFYLDHRGVLPPSRVVALHDIATDLTPGTFDLAVNVHSFSECTHDAIAWWIARLRELEISRLLIIPNEPTELLSLERDGTRRDFAPLLTAAGYGLVHREPVIDDAAVRELVRLDDHFHLFERA